MGELKATEETLLLVKAAVEALAEIIDAGRLKVAGEGAADAGGYVRQDSTGTIAKETGGNLATVKTNTDNLATILAAIRLTNGNGLTFTPVPISQAGAGTLQLAAKAADKCQRLHFLFGSITAGGTVQIQDKDGGALTGALPVATYGGVVVPFTADPRGAVRPAGETVNKGLQLVSTGGGFNGFAVVSQET
jgi:hypothetical protein